MIYISITQIFTVFNREEDYIIININIIIIITRIIIIICIYMKRVLKREQTRLNNPKYKNRQNHEYEYKKQKKLTHQTFPVAELFHDSVTLMLRVFRLYHNNQRVTIKLPVLIVLILSNKGILFSHFFRLP